MKPLNPYLPLLTLCLLTPTKLQASNNYATTNGTIAFGSKEKKNYSQYTVEEFIQYSNLAITGDYNGTPLGDKIPLRQIEELAILPPKLNSKHQNTFTIRIRRRKDQKEFLLSNAKMIQHTGLWIAYKILDPTKTKLKTIILHLTPNPQTTYKLAFPILIRFGKNIGRVKACPKEHNKGEHTLFPPSFLYCPYHQGQKLQWHPLP